MSTTTQKVVMGVLAGAATGAILGILFAPNKGSETRQKISKTSKDAVSDIKEKLEDLMHSVSGSTNHTTEKKKNASEAVEDQVNEFKKGAHSTIN